VAGHLPHVRRCPEAEGAAAGFRVRALVATLDTSRLGGIRDRALLVLGSAGAFRRSELVALDVANVAETADGLVVTIRRSKTDREGEGASIGLPLRLRPDDPRRLEFRVSRSHDWSLGRRA